MVFVNGTKSAFALIIVLLFSFGDCKFATTIGKGIW